MEVILNLDSENPQSLVTMAKGDMFECFVTVCPVIAKYWFQNI